MVVSNSGDCYIGGKNLNQNENYGVENARKYNNTFNTNIFDAEYVRIYDKGNASSANVTRYGGAIITENNDVYIFVNNNEVYKTPTYLCSGYVSAIVGNDSKIYLLSENGVLEYIDIDAPEKTYFIGNNIKKFDCESKDGVFSIFALTNDNDLYIINSDEQIKNNPKYLSDISDFDVLVPHENFCVFSFLNTKGEAYMLMKDCDIFYDIFTEDTRYAKTGENVQSVTVYSEGLAMLDNKNNLSIYGYDFKNSTDELDFTGEIVFSDVEAVFGGHRVLGVLKNNGDFYQYGNQVDISMQKQITP